MRLATSACVVLLAAGLRLIAAESCSNGTLYLTIDTGSMKPAADIAQVLRKHNVRATFFVANEKTWRGDTALDPAWTAFWKSLANEGHTFGSHTWRHWYFRRDAPGNKVAYVPLSGAAEVMDQKQLCQELSRPAEAFFAMTGRRLDPIWRAPGGRHTARTLEFARACGYEHVGWSDAGFLGDELPSEKFPNHLLVDRALKNLRDGDILLMHLGIRSRKDPFWPMLDPLLSGLRQKGFCFATLPKREASKGK